MIGKECLDLDCVRRFGIEIEINSFDMLDRPVVEGTLPAGIHYVGNLVQKITGEKVLIHKWGHDHNNDQWIIKPDGSCGMEVCTPVFKGWNGVIRTCRVIEAFSNDPKISSDHRCSFHVHVDVSDLTEAQLASVITWWLKCEPVFLDSVPASRKKNQYCQFLGTTEAFPQAEYGLFPHDTLFTAIGWCKYNSLNTYHYLKKRRKTIEFRIMDGECCLNPWMAKNWIRLILHFVEMAVRKGMPNDYEPGNRWTGYCWLDPRDVFDVLGFLPERNDLSPALSQVRHWFLTRLKTQSLVGCENGVMSLAGRRVARAEIDQLCAELATDPVEITEEQIYGENFRI